MYWRAIETLRGGNRNINKKNKKYRIIAMSADVTSNESYDQDDQLKSS